MLKQYTVFVNVAHVSSLTQFLHMIKHIIVFHVKAEIMTSVDDASYQFY